MKYFISYFNDRPAEMKVFEKFCESFVWNIRLIVDGEIIDAIEHFFWGKRKGIALELGALDGSPHTHSMTFGLEEKFGWNRILVEGNPKFKQSVIQNSPKSIAVSAAICETLKKVHFVDVDYTGGIIEYMSHPYLKKFHSEIYESGKLGQSRFNISLVNWSKFPSVKKIFCLPLQMVFNRLKIHRINLFVLDVEVIFHHKFHLI